MGTVNEDGYLFIVDRRKDLVIRRGDYVYPREIEVVLYEHPAARQAAVIGPRREPHGYGVAAAVVLKPAPT